MRPDMAQRADDSRERFVDAAIVAAILLMLAAVLSLLTWVGWLAYKTTPPVAPKSPPVENVRAE